MSYWDEDWEPTQEELEEMDGMENTKTQFKSESLKIEFNTENFASGIIAAVVSEVKQNLYKEVIDKIKKDIVEDIQETIRLQSHEIVKEIINDYMQNEKIKIGGSSFWDNEPLQEFTMQEYAKKCIGDTIEKGQFNYITGWEKDKYNSSKNLRAKTATVTYAEYIRSELAIGNDVKEYIDKQIMDVKDNVNKGVKAIFDASTKNMLSESILKVLMANDTYKQIESNIACIADRTVN